jgi:hypothetical protein
MTATKESSDSLLQHGTNNSHTNEESDSGNPLLQLVNAASRLEPSSETPEAPALANNNNSNNNSTEDVLMKETTTTPTTTSAPSTEATPPKDENKAPLAATTTAATLPAPSLANDSSTTETSTTHAGSSQSYPTTTPTTSDAVTPPQSNVLLGTKEDLLLDPKLKLTFAEHLYNILEDAENHDVLQWMPHGQAFTVVNHKKFVLQKMPTLFNIRNMSSFVRKLGRWGFCRVFEKETNNSDVFKHPHFIRGARAQVRKQVKCLGRSAQKPSSANGSRQPDFVVRAVSHHQDPVLVNRDLLRASSGVSLDGSFRGMDTSGRSYSDRLSLGSTGGGSYNLPPHHHHGNHTNSGLDHVTNASAASAEALYLSHQQAQKLKMERLANEQQHLEDMQIESLMKRRELRHQQQMQEQRFLLDQQQQQQQQQHRRLLLEANGGIGGGGGNNNPHGMSANHNSAAMLMSKQQQRMPTMNAPAHNNSMNTNAYMGANNMSNTNSATMEAMQHQQASQGRSAMMQNLAASNTLAAGMDLRRVSMQSASLDNSLGRSASSRYSQDASLSTASLASTSNNNNNGPYNDSRKVLSAAYETLQRDEVRSRERQAAIRALLVEEQEFEARRRAVALRSNSLSSLGASLGSSSGMQPPLQQHHQQQLQQQHQSPVLTGSPGRFQGTPGSLPMPPIMNQATANGSFMR